MTEDSFGNKGRKAIRFVIYDNRTIPFLLGMILEAAGLGIQFALGLPAYPILDVLVAGMFVIVLYYLQRKRDVQ